MALTIPFKDIVMARAKRDVVFRRMIFVGAINEFLNGDIDAGKAMLRDYINATISFEPLARKLHKNSKSIQRMLSANGNPTSKSLFSILHILQKAEGVSLQVKIKKAS